jgi:hypothetical protein
LLQLGKDEDTALTIDLDERLADIGRQLGVLGRGQ